MEITNISTTTMRDYMRVLFRQKAVIITCVFTVMATAIVGLLFQTPTYTASSKLLITAAKQVEATYYRDISYGQQNIEIAITQTEIVKAMPVLNRAVGSIGLWQRPLDYELNYAAKIKKPFIRIAAQKQLKKMAKLTDDQKKAYQFRMAVESLKENIKVDPIRNTNLFVISVRDHSPVGAAILANVISRSYVIFDLEQQLAELQLKYGEKHLSVLQLQDNIVKLTKGLNGEPLSDVDAIGPASVKIIEQAQVPLRPDGLPRSITIIFVFCMSVFLGLMLAFTFEYMDQTFKSPQDIETFLNLPYLGSIPPRPRAKSFDLIDEQLLLLSKDKGLKTLMFTTSIFEKESQGAVYKIARSIAEKETLKVLVIDMNFRKVPIEQKSSKVKVEASCGLVDVIEKKVPLENAIKAVSNNLSILESGKTALNPITFLDSPTVEKILKDAAERFDLVLVETPDLGKKECFFLMGYVDGVILIVNENKTRKHVAKAMLDLLKKKNIRIFGVILNNRKFLIPRIIYEKV